MNGLRKKGEPLLKAISRRSRYVYVAAAIMLGAYLIYQCRHLNVLDKMKMMKKLPDIARVVEDQERNSLTHISQRSSLSVKIQPSRELQKAVREVQSIPANSSNTQIMDESRYARIKSQLASFAPNLWRHSWHTNWRKAQAMGLSLTTLLVFYFIYLYRYQWIYWQRKVLKMATRTSKNDPKSENISDSDSDNDNPSASDSDFGVDNASDSDFGVENASDSDFGVDSDNDSDFGGDSDSDSDFGGDNASDSDFGVDNDNDSDFGIDNDNASASDSDVILDNDSSDRDKDVGDSSEDNQY